MRLAITPLTGDRNLLEDLLSSPTPRRLLVREGAWVTWVTDQDGHLVALAGDRDDPDVLLAREHTPGGHLAALPATPPGARKGLRRAQTNLAAALTLPGVPPTPGLTPLPRWDGSRALLADPTVLKDVLKGGLGDLVPVITAGGDLPLPDGVTAALITAPAVWDEGMAVAAWSTMHGKPGAHLHLDDPRAQAHCGAGSGAAFRPPAHTGGVHVEGVAASWSDLPTPVWALTDLVVECGALLDTSRPPKQADSLDTILVDLAGQVTAERTARARTDGPHQPQEDETDRGDLKAAHATITRLTAQLERSRADLARERAGTVTLTRQVAALTRPEPAPDEDAEQASPAGQGPSPVAPLPVPDDVAACGSFQQVTDWAASALTGVHVEDQALVVADLESQTHRVGAWVASYATALTVLDGWVRSRAAGWEGTAGAYAQQAGLMAASDVAMTESKAVKDNSGWLGKRVRACCSQVADGREGTHTFLPHVKLAGARHPAPRVHFDVGRDGRVHVGYVGPHLPNAETRSRKHGPWQN